MSNKIIGVLLLIPILKIIIKYYIDFWKAYPTEMKLLHSGVFAVIGVYLLFM